MVDSCLVVGWLVFDWCLKLKVLGRERKQKKMVRTSLKKILPIRSPLTDADRAPHHPAQTGTPQFVPPAVANFFASNRLLNFA